MLAPALSRRGVFLSIILMLPAISSHAVDIIRSHYYTAARTVDEGVNIEIMNEHSLSGYGASKNKKIKPAAMNDDAPPVITRTSFPDTLCPTAPPVFFIWLGSAPKPEHKQNMFEWYYRGHPVILWYHPAGLGERDKQKIRNIESIFSSLRDSPLITSLFALDLRSP